VAGSPAKEISSFARPRWRRPSSWDWVQRPAWRRHYARRQRAENRLRNPAYTFGSGAKQSLPTEKDQPGAGQSWGRRSRVSERRGLAELPGPGRQAGLRDHDHRLQAKRPNRRRPSLLLKGCHCPVCAPRVVSWRSPASRENGGQGWGESALVGRTGPDHSQQQGLGQAAVRCLSSRRSQRFTWGSLSAQAL